MAFLDPMGPTAPLIAEEVTGDPAALAANQRDPRRRHMWTINSTATTTLCMIDQLKYTSCLADIKVPALIAHGADDIICYPKGSEEVFMKIGSAPADKGVLVVPGLKHEICADVEPKSSEIIADMVKFADKHGGRSSSSSGSSPASGCGAEAIRAEVDGVSHRRLRAATQEELNIILATKSK